MTAVIGRPIVLSFSASAGPTQRIASRGEPLSRTPMMNGSLVADHSALGICDPNNLGPSRERAVTVVTW